MLAISKEPGIEKRFTEVIVPYNNGERVYAFRVFGPNLHEHVGKEILKHGFSVPYGDYTAPLIHAVYCSNSRNKEEFQEIREIVKENRLWVYNRNLWTDSGVYVIQDEKALGTNAPPSIKSLESTLKGGKELSLGGVRFSKDGKVRFAPKQSYLADKYQSHKGMVYRLHKSQTLAKDGLIIAQYGQQGAELLAEAAAATPNTGAVTYILSVEDGGKPEMRVSTIAEDKGRLHFLCNEFDGPYVDCEAEGQCAVGVKIR